MLVPLGCAFGCERVLDEADVLDGGAPAGDVVADGEVVGGVLDCSSGSAPGISSGCGLGNCTGRITPVFVIIRGQSFAGVAQAGRRRGLLLVRIAATSPSRMVRVLVSASSGVPAAISMGVTTSLVKICKGSPIFGNLDADDAIAVDAHKVDFFGRRAVDPLLKGHLAVHLARFAGWAGPWRTSPYRCSCRPAPCGRGWRL